MNVSSAVLVSVIIPCRNERRYLQRFYECLSNQRTAGLRWEAIFADGCSNDGSRELLDRIAAHDNRIKVIDNPELIVSSGLNRSIRQATGNVIVRMDVHTEYAEDYIAACVSELLRTGASNVGGPWRARGDGFIERVIAAGFNSPLGGGGARCHNTDYEGPVDTVYLGCWWRSIFDEVGLFDEALVRNQDDEFNLRLVRAGKTVWQSPAIISWYVPRGTFPRLFRQYLQYGFWKVRVIKKHGAPGSVRHLVPGAFVAANVAVSVCAVSCVVSKSDWALVALSGWGALLTLYTIICVVSALKVARRKGFVLAPVLPLVYVIFHVAYGTGFLLGLLYVTHPMQRSRHFANLSR